MQIHNLSNWSCLRYKIRKRKLNRFYSRWIEKFHKNKGALLDIGCGDGSFMSYMKDLGWDAFGVEVDKNIVKNMPRELETKVRLVNVSLDEANFEEDSFDVVTLWNAFEHISDSDGLLNLIKKILKKNGLLVLQAPNICSLEAWIFKMDWIHLDPPRHVHHFSADILSLLLDRKNFKIKALTYCSPIDKSYRGSFENLLKSKFPIKINPYFFHNIFYKIVLDFMFIPLTIIGSFFKKGTFITMACINGK